MRIILWLSIVFILSTKNVVGQKKDIKLFVKQYKESEKLLYHNTAKKFIRGVHISNLTPCVESRDQLRQMQFTYYPVAVCKLKMSRKDTSDFLTIFRHIKLKKGNVGSSTLLTKFL